ncbi:MAG: hypothetical protein AAB914_04430 [Patescibacteria group bacterium]
MKLEFDPARNNAFFDIWTIVHVISGILFGWLMNPWIALLIMTLWEPIEIFVISPLLAKHDIEFGYEGPLNSFSDILFNVVGLLIGIFVLAKFFAPPFFLF